MKARLVLFLVAVAATPAFAHAFLDHARPGAGAVETSAPKVLTLSFTENLEAAFSGVTVSDVAGHNVEQSPPDIAGTVMTVALKPLPAGRYHVAWRAVSKDGHRTEGGYGFSVEP